MADAFAWPDLLSAVFLLAAIAAWGWWMERRRPRGRPPGVPAPDEPEGTPYRVFTTACDRAVRAEEAPALLAREDGVACIGPPRDVASLDERVAAADRWAITHATMLADAAALLSPLLARSGADLAITLLIDHSGSMRERMVPVAATLRWFSALCDAHAVALSCAGFTTLGWRGGEPRRRWIANGRPARPGRLCALLHLLYRPFDGSLEAADWRVMLDPAVLRENVDGEAIAWAVGSLRQRPEPVRLLIVISDGAPVDDSTLMENGPSFLERDVLRRIGDVEAADDVTVGGIGIGYRVDRYYPRSRAATDLAMLPGALADLAAEMMLASRS